MKNNSGFTLIELILVTVIIGILAGMVVQTFGGRMRETQIRAAKGDIRSLQNAIELFAIDNNDVYPASLTELEFGNNPFNRAYIKEPAIDPWGNPYNYTPGSTRAANSEIWSTGPPNDPIEIWPDTPDDS